MYNFGHSVSVHLSKAYKGFFANKLCPALRPIEKNDDITQLKFRFSNKAKKNDEISQLHSELEVIILRIHKISDNYIVVRAYSYTFLRFLFNQHL